MVEKRTEASASTRKIKKIITETPGPFIMIISSIATKQFSAVHEIASPQ